jgi:hypothetical protein
MVGAMLLLLPAIGRAETLASADFSTYADGNLVGQNGWQQFQSPSTAPLQVTGGQVAWPGGSTANNQDAMLAFPQQIVQPLSGTTVLNYDMLVNVTAPSAGSPSYFAALNTLTGTATSGNFQNARIVASGTTGGFVFGARVNGQSGYPFAFGTSVLDVGTDYALRAEINMVAGNANDFIRLFVGPDFDNLSLYATAAYGSGTVNDPLFGAMLISQFGSGSVSEPGVAISTMSVTLVPEPSAMMLAGLGGLVVVGRMLRRR